MLFKIILSFLFLVNFSFASEKKVIRVGHFPNVTHAQGVIGHALTREGKGWFERYLGPDVEVQWYTYNAGPSATEAIFSQSIDLTYAGPIPSVNSYIRSKGKEIRIIAGTCSQGAALVVHQDEGIKNASDFKGKKVGTPQFGNTQDLSARSWLKNEGYHVTLTGGDVLVIPTENPSQLALFKTHQLDAVWTVEPWVSQLVLDGKAKVFLEESEIWPETKGNYITAQLISREKYLAENPELIKKFLLAHVELTEWINKNPEEAKALFIKELKAETSYIIKPHILDRAWGKITLTYDPFTLSLYRYAEEAFEVGIFKNKPDLSYIYALDPLNQILREKGLPEVR